MIEQSASPEIFATATLAGLYLDQGAYPEAAEIYKKLLLKSPSDLEIKRQLEQALSRMSGHPERSISRTGEGDDTALKAWKLSYLQAWLNRIQMERQA